MSGGRRIRGFLPALIHVLAACGGATPGAPDAPIDALAEDGSPEIRDDGAGPDTPGDEPGAGDDADGAGDASLDGPEAGDDAPGDELGAGDDGDGAGPPPALDGAFLALDGSNAAWSAERWVLELEWMRHAGLRTAIVQAAVFEGQAYYPTAIAGLTETGSRPIEKVLAAADAADMEVHLGLQLTDAWWSGTDAVFLDGLATLSSRIADELWALYGSHRSLAGFYVTQEIDNLTWMSADRRALLVEHFLRPLTAHLASLDADLAVSTSPFFNSVFATPAEFGAWWGLVLAATPDLDLLLPQDGIGAGHATPEQVVEYFRAIGEACAAHGRTMWANVEVYAGTMPDLFPAPIERLREQLACEAPLVSGMVCWEFGYYLSPGRSLASFELSVDYARYREGLGPLRNAALGRGYEFGTAASTEHPDRGGALTDGSAAPDWGGLVGWGGATRVTVDIDLGSLVGDLTHLAALFYRSDASAAPLPGGVAAAVSDDGASFAPLGDLAPVCADDEHVDVWELRPAGPARGRFVRFDIVPGGFWLLLSELAVYVPEP